MDDISHDSIDRAAARMANLQGGPESDPGTAGEIYRLRQAVTALAGAVVDLAHRGTAARADAADACRTAAAYLRLPPGD